MTREGLSQSEGGDGAGSAADGVRGRSVGDGQQGPDGSAPASREHAAGYGGDGAVLGAGADAGADALAAAALEATYANAPVGLCVLDTDLRWVCINDRLAEINGLPAAAHLGRRVRDVLPGLADEAERLMARILETGEPVLGVEISGETPAQPGVRRVWEENWLPIRDARGRIVGVSVVAEEVTERRRFEAALRAGEEFTRRVTDVAPCVLYVYDVEERRNVWGNREMFEGLGYDRARLDSFAGDLLGALLHPDDHAPYAAHAARLRALADGEAAEFEYRLRRADGSWCWLHSRDMVFRRAEPGGGVRQIIGAAIDVTERRRAEAALRESEARFRQIADAMPQMVFAARPDGHVDYHNRRWYEYTGLPEDGATGDASWASVHEPEGRERVARLWGEALRTGQPYEIEYRLRRRDGAWRWHLGRAVPVRDDAGNIVRWFGTNTDVHEQTLARAREEFLVALDDAVRPLTDAGAVIETAARLLGEYLGVDRCAYADVEDDQDTMNLRGNYTRGPEVRSIVGRLRFSDFGAEVLALMRADLPYVVDDVTTHEPPVGDPSAYEATQIRAVVCVPLHKAGRFAAAMAVHCTTPRAWRADEVELVGQVAARCWESIERVRVAATLRESEERYRLLTLATNQIVWWTDASGGVVKPMPLWGAFTGQSEAQYRGWGWLDVIHPGDRERIAARWKESLESRDYYEVEYRLRRHDGVWRHTIARAVPLLHPATGEPVEWIGASVDVTEQRDRERRERFLAGLSDRLHALEGNAPPEALLAEALRAAGEFLGAARCSLGAVDAATGTVAPAGEWRRDAGVPAVPERDYPLSGFGEALVEEAIAGRSVSVADTEADPRLGPPDVRAVFASLAVRAFVSVPLIRDGACVGLFSVHEDTPRAWTAGEVELVEAVAGRVWLAAENARLRREREEAARKNERIAETLQRSLLASPPRPDAFPGFRVAALYEPAWDDADVGGDFYDAFPLDERRFALVVGDVTGKGLQAAAHTAEVKYALRSLLRESPDAPAEVLTRVNRQLVAEQRLADASRAADRAENAYACASVVVVDRETGEVHASSAGAEPPLIVRRGGAGAGDAYEELFAGGPMLGAMPEPEYASARGRIDPGDLLLVLTDGLTEARRGRAFFGAAGVARVARGASGADAARIGAAIVAGAKAFAGGQLRDDVCLVVARREG